MPASRTRLAPSPTGALHLGNMRTFLVNWAVARQRGWEVVLRVEDLDGPRFKEGASEAMIETMAWLGLDWDEGPYFQRNDLTAYREATARLADLGHVYPCGCTRKEIQAASLSAPHGDQHELHYPGTCRPNEKEAVDKGLLGAEGVAWRVQVPSGATSFEDAFAGAQSYDVARSVGDFLVGTKLGLPSYQLAVVVDDARQGINQVFRGDDLLSSTPRQMLLYELLELGPQPTYMHVPLVLGEDGKRLAKRHGDTRVAYYREQGAAPEKIVGLLAEWCGVGKRHEMTAEQFVQEFDLERLSSEPVVFTATDDAWLLEG